MSNWLTYPQHQPSESDIDADFMVLTPNQRAVRKQGYSQMPEYVSEQAIWTGKNFVNKQWQPLDVRFYFQLPPLREKTMTPIQQIKEEFEKTWPPIIARKKVADYTGGLYTTGTMAAYDAQGIGVPNPIRIQGREVAYVKSELIKWIISKMEAANVTINK